MSLKVDQFWALSLRHTSAWDTAKTESSSRKWTQPHVPLRSLYTDSYLRSTPESGRGKEKAIANWSSLIGLTSEDGSLSHSLLRESSLDDITSGHERQRVKDIDVTTFGNLCVDIVLKVPTLPPASREEKLAFMNNLTKSSPDEEFWEAGGNSNFAIAAARLGLHCDALGHVGYERYGRFLCEVLEKEGVQVIRLDDKENTREETLICWVLVDPDHRHGFCSRFDFNKEPAFKCIKELASSAKEIIQRSKVLFLNGFLFDELAPDLITSSVSYANQEGCLVFFDPGPRGKSLSRGSKDQQRALRKILRLSDVLLLTADEAEALSGISDPMLSAKHLLATGQCTKWVIVKMGEEGCILTSADGVYCVPAFKVDVKDTVGCGDSFAAAIALGYVRGLPIASTLALANAVGAATAMGCGAGRNVATLCDVINILVSSEVRDDPDQSKKSLGFRVKEGARPQLDKDTSRNNSADADIPFHIIAHQAVSLLRNSIECSGFAQGSAVAQIE